jgi:hypothetical protein
MHTESRAEQVCAVAKALRGSMCRHSLHPSLNYGNFEGVEPFKCTPLTIFTASFNVPNSYVQIGYHNEQRLFPLTNVNRLFFITEMMCVCFEVGSDLSRV